MKKDNIKNLSLFLNGVFITSLFFGMLWAEDINGIWTLAEDIRGGTFGFDEQHLTTNYTFVNPLYLTSNLTLINITNCDGKLYTDNKGQIFCGIDRVDDAGNDTTNEYPIAGIGIITDNRIVNVDTNTIATKNYISANYVENTGGKFNGDLTIRDNLCLDYSGTIKCISKWEDVGNYLVQVN